MFEIKKLSKQYDTFYALENVSMTIGKGMNFITGASGSGKTTLLKIMCGMEEDYQGEVYYGSQNIKEWTAYEKSSLYNSEFGFVWQDFHLLEEATVIENILLPTCLKKQKSQKNIQKILKQMKIDDIQNQKVKTLSGGQKQRVAIARELMKDPKVLLCDEPTSALDLKNAQMIVELLRNISKKRVVIVVTHDTSLIKEHDHVFHFDKGQLVLLDNPQVVTNQPFQNIQKTKLTLQNAFQLAIMNIKNKICQSIVAILCLLIAGIFMLVSMSGVVMQSGQSEFDQLIKTYGEGILDINLIGSFMSASGANGQDNQQPGGSVNQDLEGLYEKYQDDQRVEYVVSMQAFENIKVTMDQQIYTIEKTGNSPVLNKLLIGDIPVGHEYQVVVPLKFVENSKMTKEDILGKKIDFSATIFQWVHNQPLEKPVHISATICGVADNTVVYDYEGKTYSFCVDDSFFFNKAAILEMRKQAGVDAKSGNFTLRAKTPADLIDLKDELNRSGIVPLGQFELVEDIVRLNEQTTHQSGVTSLIMGVIAIVMVGVVFTMSSWLRKREYAIFKVSGFHDYQIFGVSFFETILYVLTALGIMIVLLPGLEILTQNLFHVSILSFEKVALGCGVMVGITMLTCLMTSFIIKTTSLTVLMEVGEKS